MTLDPETTNAGLLAATATRRTKFTEADLRRFEGHMSEIFTAFGLDLGASGDRSDAATLHPGPDRLHRRLRRGREAPHGVPDRVPRGRECELNQVVEGPIPFFSLCEHHALPFHGKVFVGYIAHEQIIGLSKLTRLVRLFARRFTVQERMGQQIVDTLESLLAPHGVAVYIDAHHLCTQMRGVREDAPSTRTTMWRGQYAEAPSLRSEFMTICGSLP